MVLLLVLLASACKPNNSQDQSQASNSSGSINGESKNGLFSLTRSTINNESYNKVQFNFNLQGEEYFAVKICNKQSGECNTTYRKDNPLTILGLEAGSYLLSVGKCYETSEGSKCDTVVKNQKINQGQYQNQDNLYLHRAINTNDELKRKSFLSIMENIGRHEEEISACVSDSGINEEDIAPEIVEYMDFILSINNISNYDLVNIIQPGASQLNLTGNKSKATGFNLTDETVSYRATVITWYGANPILKQTGHSTLLLEKIQPNGDVLDGDRVYLSYAMGNDFESDLEQFGRKNDYTRVALTDITEEQFEKGRNWFTNSIYDYSFFVKSSDATLERRHRTNLARWNIDYDDPDFKKQAAYESLSSSDKKKFDFELDNYRKVQDFVDLGQKYVALSEIDPDSPETKAALEKWRAGRTNLWKSYANGYGFLGNNCACAVRKMLFEITGNRAFKPPTFIPTPFVTRNRFQNNLGKYQEKVKTSDLDDFLANPRYRGSNLRNLKVLKPKTKNPFRFKFKLVETETEYDEKNVKLSQCILNSLQTYQNNIHESAAAFDYFNQLKNIITGS